MSDIKTRPGRAAIPAPELDALTFCDGGPIDKQVYNTIRRAMISGAIQPGARVSSRSIAASLGVSTMPVREALKRLESDGSLESSMKSAYFVPRPSAAEYAEILEIRLKLEVLLARAAVPQIKVEDIDKIAWLQERIVQSKNWRQVLNYNQQMHFSLYAAANMPYVLALVENVWVRSGPVLHMIYESHLGTSTLDSHYAIIEGLRRRDADRVAAAIEADLSDAGNVIIDLLETVQPRGPGPGTPDDP
ncbi:GntR family transcriptional regulator [Sphingopyxis sp.]|uniref:GntR family transcriptional regulator n=1 Tax=Sphingopyxis sp. TaxID=1908224 RepID=UPI001E106C8F|nr:GntR family transcriptional regulator [Sphingopyxis sp.]MBW8296349.1 GntR family transcriptional regulator [Sphingopyxis sp.]